MELSHHIPYKSVFAKEPLNNSASNNLLFYLSHSNWMRKLCSILLSTLSAYMLQCEGHRKSWEEAFIILTLRSIFKYSKFKTLSSISAHGFSSTWKYCCLIITKLHLRGMNSRYPSSITEIKSLQCASSEREIAMLFPLV